MATVQRQDRSTTRKMMPRITSGPPTGFTVATVSDSAGHARGERQPQDHEEEEGEEQRPAGHVEQGEARPGPPERLGGPVGVG